MVTGLISAAIICATMSSADSNLLCMSTMIINDLYTGLGGKKQLTDKQTIFYTRACNVLSAVVAMLISLFGVSIVAMNTFASAFAAPVPSPHMAWAWQCPSHQELPVSSPSSAAPSPLWCGRSWAAAAPGCS